MANRDPREYTLSSQDAARRLGVSGDALRRWARDGRLPCLRTPGGFRKFRNEDVDAFAATMLPDEASA